MIQFLDILESPMTRLFGETLDQWKERQIKDYTPKFKELARFNDSMGYTKVPVEEACKHNNLTVDQFCEGYVFECFEGIDQETFELMQEKYV